MATSYIGADVDCKWTDLAVERRNKVVRRYRVPTTIPALRAVLEQIPAPKELTFEEGPLAHWLRRELQDCVDRLVVCDPRRNAYVAKDGDKDDPIDAGKLAELLRGGYLREVYHSDDAACVQLKRWVGLYHDRRHAAVREINKLRAAARLEGVRLPRRVLRDPITRSDWLAALADADLREQLELRGIGLDAALEQARRCRRRLSLLARAFAIIQAWQAVPGVGLIRATTLRAYLDTPWRFCSRQKLWKYCGIGLQRCSSGKDRHGRPAVGHLQLAWQVNKRLKDAVMGATLSAIRQGHNPFAAHYERTVAHGVSPANARHTVARKLLCVLWAMWKTHQPFDPAGLSAQIEGLACDDRRRQADGFSRPPQVPGWH